MMRERLGLVRAGHVPAEVHRAEAERADLQPGSTEMHVLHVAPPLQIASDAPDDLRCRRRSTNRTHVVALAEPARIWRFRRSTPSAAYRCAASRSTSPGGVIVISSSPSPGSRSASAERLAQTSTDERAVSSRSRPHPYQPFAVLGGPPQCRRGAAPDDDRRMRPLDRARDAPARPRTRTNRPVERPDAVRSRSTRIASRYSSVRVAAVGRTTHRAPRTRARRTRPRCRRCSAAAGQHVERRELLREDQRVAERQHDDAGAEPQRGRAAGHERERRHGLQDRILGIHRRRRHARVREPPGARRPRSTRARPPRRAPRRARARPARARADVRRAEADLHPAPCRRRRTPLLRLEERPLEERRVIRLAVVVRDPVLRVAPPVRIALEAALDQREHPPVLLGIGPRPLILAARDVHAARCARRSGVPTRRGGSGRRSSSGPPQRAASHESPSTWTSARSSSRRTPARAPCVDATTSPFGRAARRRDREHALGRGLDAHGARARRAGPCRRSRDRRPRSRRIGAAAQERPARADRAGVQASNENGSSPRFA